MMEILREQKTELFNLLDRVATNQHIKLLEHLLSRVKPYMVGKPELLVLPNAYEHIKSTAEAAVDLEMRGKTPERIDFGGYTLVVRLGPDYPFDTLYFTRPFTNKLTVTTLVEPLPILPFSLRMILNPQNSGVGSEGFNPNLAFIIQRSPAPRLPAFVTNPTEFITTAVLLRESLETSPFNQQVEASLCQAIPFPIEKEVGKRFFPPLQVVRSGADDILLPESYLLTLPTVPLLVTHAAGPKQTLIQLETVPSWPEAWNPVAAFSTGSERVKIIGEGIDYDVSSLISLLAELAKAATASEDFTWPF
ncbi:MAG: hypothetical protein ACFFDP_13135 [Promethearchaeota archaeon]